MDQSQDTVLELQRLRNRVAELEASEKHALDSEETLLRFVALVESAEDAIVGKTLAGTGIKKIHLAT